MTAAVTDSSVLVESLVVEWLAPLMYTHKAARVSRLRSSPAVLCMSVAVYGTRDPGVGYQTRLGPGSLPGSLCDSRVLGWLVISITVHTVVACSSM